MTEQTKHITAQPDAAPARIQLDDFIEAVSRGVARALAAEEEVGGYVMGQPRPTQERPFVIGLYFPTNPSGPHSPTGPFQPILEQR